MAVDDVGDPVHVVQGGQGSLAEEAVLGDVVHQIDIGVAGGEELLVVDEVVYHAVPDILHDAHIVAAAGLAQVHVKLAPVDHLVLVLLGDAGVAGQDHPHVAVELGQRPGQGVHHIAQTARLDKRMALGTDKRNAPAGQIGHLTHGNSLLFYGYSLFRSGCSLLNSGGFLLPGGSGFLSGRCGLFLWGSGFVPGGGLFALRRLSLGGLLFGGRFLPGLRLFLCRSFLCGRLCLLLPSRLRFLLCRSLVPSGLRRFCFCGLRLGLRRRVGGGLLLGCPSGLRRLLLLNGDNGLGLCVGQGFLLRNRSHRLGLRVGQRLLLRDRGHGLGRRMGHGLGRGVGQGLGLRSRLCPGRRLLLLHRGSVRCLGGRSGSRSLVFRRVFLLGICFFPCHHESSFHIILNFKVLVAACHRGGRNFVVRFGPLKKI